MACYIREMTGEDLKDVSEIDREAFPTQWPAPNYGNELRNRMAHFIVACDGDRPLPKPIAEAATSQKQGWLSSLARRLFGRATLPQRAAVSASHYIIGFVGFWIMSDEAHITSIAVREKYRRHGVGEMLMISAIENASELKADILTLEVRVSNTGAQALYTKYGFKQVGLRKGYYTDNREDAFIMSTDRIAAPAFQERFQRLKQAFAERKVKS